MMYLRWFGHLGTLASLLGIIFMMDSTESPSSFVMGFFIALAIIMFCFVIFLEMKLFKQNKGVYCKNDEEINDYMFNWISKEGVVTVFTRDMSWAQDDPVIKRLLFEKSQGGELVIILAENKDLTKQLEKSGAKIYTYGELNYIPNSRFTIVRSGRIDSEVAVGKEQNGKHFIQEFSSSDGYQFHIANDMVSFLIKYNELNQKGNNKNENSK